MLSTASSWRRAAAAEGEGALGGGTGKAEAQDVGEGGDAEEERGVKRSAGNAQPAFLVRCGPLGTAAQEPCGTQAPTCSSVRQIWAIEEGRNGRATTGRVSTMRNARL
jgi:hypothetical protein